MPWPVFSVRSTTTMSGLVRSTSPHGLEHVAGLAADFQIGLVRDHVGQAAADQRMVVDQQNAVLLGVVFETVVF